MPIYEFDCKDCNMILEESCAMKDARSEVECPDCGKIAKRHYGSMSFILKGGGWPGKNIKQGKSGCADNAFEADQMTREKNGQKTYGKEVPMSDTEFKRRKKLTERFIDENAGK